MALIVKKETYLSVKALNPNSKEKGDEVIQLDQIADDYDDKIQSSILQLIMIQPPLPDELQKLTAMIRISREYERIGDNAVNIADLSQDTNINEKSNVYQRIAVMCEHNSSMLEDSIDVLRTKDNKQAQIIEEKDDQIDEFFYDNQKFIIKQMKSEKSVDMKTLANLLLVNRYLERSGDHVVNVMRQVRRGNY